MICSKSILQHKLENISSIQRNNQACSWELDYHGNPTKNFPRDGMGWDMTARISFARRPMGSSHVMELTELSLTETVDEQEIENLLNEHSDSEYECQNDNEL